MKNTKIQSSNNEWEKPQIVILSSPKTANASSAMFPDKWGGCFYPKESKLPVNTCSRV